MLRNVLFYIKQWRQLTYFLEIVFFLVKSDTRLKEIKEDFFRVSSNFQIIKVSGGLFVVDLSLVEKMFGFHDVIKKRKRLRECNLSVI
ncbi:Kiwa anti-phage protein KwaB-like domain-containing protein [Dickeya oryzae]